MGRASRAKKERAQRLRKFYYNGRQVGWELSGFAGPTVPNPPAEPLHFWELQLPWTEIGDGA